MFKVEASENHIKVHVCLERKLARDPHQHVDTNKVIDFLEKSGYTVDSIELLEGTLCSTTGNNPPLEGTWIFTKKKAQNNVKSVKNSSTRRKTRGSRNQNEVKKDKLLRNENVDRVQPQTQASLSGQDKKVSGQ